MSIATQCPITPRPRLHLFVQVRPLTADAVIDPRREDADGVVPLVTAVEAAGGASGGACRRTLVSALVGAFSINLCLQPLSSSLCSAQRCRPSMDRNKLALRPFEAGIPMYGLPVTLFFDTLCAKKVP